MWILPVLMFAGHMCLVFLWILAVDGGGTENIAGPKCKDCYWYNDAIMKCWERGWSDSPDPESDICYMFEY